ncbi:hypothetical protein PsorP6_005952 [Peronosclerospora sorghi]|uniref:Uncharacterized protein n=1 Tax=Peronosclerospora sorghi TaxID=230839 RepID=A0ACC0W1F7_9STRA|nr:hypothetical protein PsorP6_005952 [Peronosclerospora sorghi]
MLLRMELDRVDSGLQSRVKVLIRRSERDLMFTRNHGIEKDESEDLAAFSEDILVTADVLGEDSDGATRAIFGHIGLEYQHLRNRDAALWIRERLEKYKVLEHACDHGVEVVQMGMAHRGRLNVLANVLRQPLRSIISQFQPYLPDEPDYPNNSDDVRYHRGTSSVIEMRNGKHMIVIFASNPSHLEAVNPVVLGQARACQTKWGDN